MALPPSPEGVRYARYMIAAHGSAVKRTHGRNRPQREWVRSASTPTSGSKKASQSRAMRIIVPAVPAASPKTSV